jgi:hypothetical protein
MVDKSSDWRLVSSTKEEAQASGSAAADRPASEPAST